MNDKLDGILSIKQGMDNVKLLLLSLLVYYILKKKLKRHIISYKKTVALLALKCYTTLNMATIKISEQIIKDINDGKESAFSVLYDCYFSYLCAYATTYVFDPDEAKEIVNDVFISIWNNRGHLSFPIHSYLLRGVQNRCLNYIRALHTRERVLDEYWKELVAFQEEFCENDNNPLQLLETEELKNQISAVINSLSAKCRFVFEKYLYEGMSPQEIANEQAISVNTVRVHIKNAMDHIKLQLGSSAGILLLLLLKNNP